MKIQPYWSRPCRSSATSQNRCSDIKPGGRLPNRLSVDALVWSSAVAAAGYSLAYSWDTLERWIGRSGVIALVIVALVGVFLFIRWRRDSRA